MQNNLLFIFIFKYLFVPLDFIESRLHLGKIQINLVFRSVYTTFAHTIIIDQI